MRKKKKRWTELEFWEAETKLKEELHNRFNLISEERVKMFKHNSENLMKFG